MKKLFCISVFFECRSTQKKIQPNLISQNYILN
jgi:hypothetical protein